MSTYCKHCGGLVEADGYSADIDELESPPERKLGDGGESGGRQAEAHMSVEGMETDQKESTEHMRAGAFANAIERKKKTGWGRMATTNAPTKEG